MPNTQPSFCDFSLPVGYILQNYTIAEVLFEDAFSTSYLATVNSQNNAQNKEVILVEYLPRLLSQRDPSSYNIIPTKVEFGQEYAWGLSHYLSDASDFVSINHPSIINVRTYFEAHNTAYMVTDNIAGVTLEDFTVDKTLSEEEVLSLLKPLLDGLQTIHSTGHIHSDLTPSSIIIPDDISKPVITHLGDASHLFRHHNNEITLNVSPGYSPYEHYYANDKQGAWTDIYAMGCILYRLISGITPDSSASRLTGIADHNKDPLVPVSKIVAKRGYDIYSAQLLASIDHAIKLQRIDRPQTISEWQNELGIQTNTLTSIQDTNVANPIGEFHISGVPTITENTPSKELTEVDFEALSQFPYKKTKSKTTLKQYAPLAALVTVTLVVLLIAGYSYLTEPRTNHKLAEILEKEILSSQEEINTYSSMQGLSTVMQSEATEGQLNDLPLESQLTQDEIAKESQLETAYFDEELMVVLPLKRPSNGENLASSEYLDKVSDIEDSLLQRVTTISSIIHNENRMNTEILHPQIITLTQIIRTNNKLSNVLITTTDFFEQNNLSEDAMNQKVVTSGRNDKLKVKKTRQQYQKEWLAAQKRKKSQGKTKQQYQKEWVAKQRQLKERAEWKRKKEYLKKVKTRKTIQELEKALLKDNDW